MPLIPVYLIKGLFELQPPALKLDLHKGYAVDKYGHIVAVFIASLHSDLAGDLKEVLAPVLLLKKLDIDAFAIVLRQLHLVPEDFTPLEDIALVEMICDFFKLVVGKGGFVMLFKL